MEPKIVDFERTYNAPIAKVWRAWTEPEQVKKWWGPDNVSIPECEIDLKVGGRIYIVMEAGEAMGEYAGTRWPMDGKFTKVEPESELAYQVKAWTEGDEEATTLEQVHELSFSEEDGQTKMHLKVTLNKVGPKAGMAVEGMKYGFGQQFDKLEKYLAKEA